MSGTDEYRDKRDFRSTPEPRGAVVISHGNGGHIGHRLPGLQPLHQL